MERPRLSKLSRRDFIDRTTRTLLTVGMLPTVGLPKGKTPEAGPPEGKIAPHPNIPPFRVAMIHDPGMTRDRAPFSAWKTQEKLVKPEVIHENMDRLACALAGEKRPEDAWKALFLKPPGKPWNEVTVAIKTNNIADQHTRSPVLAKLCRVLIRRLGVKAERIFIYDACHGGDMLRKTPFKGLPEGVHVAAKWGGSPPRLPWVIHGRTVKARPWHSPRWRRERWTSW